CRESTTRDQIVFKHEYCDKSPDDDEDPDWDPGECEDFTESDAIEESEVPCFRCMTENISDDDDDEEEEEGSSSEEDEEPANAAPEDEDDDDDDSVTLVERTPSPRPADYNPYQDW
ncbi:hypothetical protein OC846_003332, partial [Tilletia horrida]